jgi:hypothetical protein
MAFLLMIFLLVLNYFEYGTFSNHPLYGATHLREAHFQQKLIGRSISRSPHKRGAHIGKFHSITSIYGFLILTFFAPSKLFTVTEWLYSLMLFYCNFVFCGRLSKSFIYLELCSCITFQYA